MAVYIKNEDFKSLKEYFNKHIVPVHEQIIEQNGVCESLDKIHGETIKNIIYELENSCRNENIKFSFYIDTVVESFYMNTFDLFKILSIFFENALNECRVINNAAIELHINRTLQGIRITLSNTYGRNIKAFDTPIILKKYGQGLKIAKEIAKNYSNLNIITAKGINNFVQQIDIEKK